MLTIDTQVDAERDRRAQHDSPSASPTHIRRAKGARQHHALFALRVGLPCLLGLSGVVVLILGGIQLGLILIGTAGVSVIVDGYARQSISSSEDREREEQARRTFAETGRWPSARDSG